MEWLTRIFSGSAGGVVDSIANAADKFITTDAEKNQFKLDLETLISKRDADLSESLRSEMVAKQQILVAELSQGDNYTKRARPTLVYFGLFVIFFNYCLIPLIQMLHGATQFTPFVLPDEFWYAWGGVTATWSVGRSFERMGSQNRIVKAVTGGLKGAQSTIFSDRDAKG